MRQCVKLNKEKTILAIIRLSRNVAAVFLVIVLFNSYSIASESLEALYKAKTYRKLIDQIEERSSDEHKLSYKEHVYLITSYKKLEDLDGLIASLRTAVTQFPRKDVFGRELSIALGVKSDSFSKNLTYDIIRKKFKDESIKVLSDLYSQSSTKENFTALITYYNKERNYVSSIGLLELYARTNVKGRIYYTYLCEAQYKSEAYATAAETCGSLVENYPGGEKGNLYYGKALAKIGALDASRKVFVGASGRFPASSGIQYEVGKVLISKGDLKEGLGHLEKHLQIESTDEALILKAETLFGMRKYGEALAVFIQVCKQHQEPRKILISKFKAAHKKIKKRNEYRKKYESEVGRCKYVYRPSKKAPKGLLGGGYTKN